MQQTAPPRLDGSWHRLLSGSGVVLALKVFGALGGFLFSLWVARALGDEALGRAELFILWVTVGATLLRGGWEGAVVRAFGAWTAQGLAGHVNARFRKWTWVMVSIALAAGGAVAWGSSWLPILPGGWWLGASLGAWVILGWLAESMRGTGHVQTYALFQPGWWMLLAGLLVLALGVGPLVALGSSAVVMAVVALAATFWWFRRKAEWASEEDAAPERVDMRSLALPIWMGSVLHLVLSWADTAMLSAWLTEADVAHYRAAFRLAALLTFTQFAVNALGAPTFGALHAAGDDEGLKRTVHRIGWMNTAVALPGFLFLWFAGPWLLGLWGPAFDGPDAQTALLILAAGQAMNALSGPVMYLLNMTGGEKVGLRILAFSAALQLVLGWVWVPAYGLVGAASSAAAGMVLWNVVSLVWIRWRHGFWMVSLWNGWWNRS